MNHQIKLFIDQLQGMAAQQFPVGPVSALLREHELLLDFFTPYIFYRPDRYTRNLVYHSPEFEILILAWGPHHISPIHGHEGAKCWMRVLDGTLKFMNYDEEKEGTVHQTISMMGGPGFVDGPAVIHAVENPTELPAVSLHLYARPYRQCDVYKPECGQKVKMQIHYDTMYGKPVEE